MKKLIHLAILALSLSAYAQNGHVYLQPQHTQNSISSVLDKMKGEEGKVPDLFTRVKSGKADKHGLNELFTLIQVLDSLYFWTWDTMGNNWALDSKSTDIFYDANNNPTSLTSQTWTGSIWVNLAQFNFTYDAHNNQTGFVYRTWNGIAWQNSFQFISTYDANNNLITEVDQQWNGVAWVNAYKFIYTYDGNNNELNELDQTWNGSAWVNDFQLVFTYDANNNRTSETDQSWNGSSWDNSEQYLYTYDANHNLTSSNYKIWNGSTWDDINLSTFTYDGNNNQTGRIDQYWDGVSWVNFYKYTYTYNAANKVTKSLTQLWSGSAWGDTDQSIYTYDSNQNLIKQINQTWSGIAWTNVSVTLDTYDEDSFIEGQSTKYFDSNGAIVIDGDSTHFYFHSVVATHELLTEEGSIDVFPNPNEGKFTIDSKSEITSLEVYNLLGEQIYAEHNFTQQKQKEIDLTSFGQGIYFLNISDGKKMDNRKIVIQ